MNNAPIGIFDSGVGGLTVARAIGDQLPNESLGYIADTAHSPHGPKPVAGGRRFGQISDLDGPLLLLASDASAYMTGAVIEVDGGHLAAPL